MGDRNDYISTIYSLNYDYDSKRGFVSKVSVKMVPKDIKKGWKQYELINPAKFSEDYKKAVDDVFNFINSLSLNKRPRSTLIVDSLPPSVRSKYLSEQYPFSTCFFYIDILDPPDTSIYKYSGDSIGLAIFLTLLSSYLEIPLRDDVAVTGNLRGKFSSEIGLVGDIFGKISTIIKESDSRIHRFIIPDVWHLSGESFLNKEEVTELKSDLTKLLKEKSNKDATIFCQSVFESLFFTFAGKSGDFPVLLDAMLSNSICTYYDLFGNFLSGKKIIYCNNSKMFEQIESDIKRAILFASRFENTPNYVGTKNRAFLDFLSPIL